MRTLTARILVFAGIALAFAIIAMPANWLRLFVPRAWPIQMVSASGTVWKGSALIAVGASGRERTIKEPIQWQLTWSRGPILLVEHPWLERALSLSLSWRGWEIPGQNLTLPAAILNTLHATLNAVSPGGALTLRWPDLPQPDTASPYVLTWNNASSALTTVRPLGNYQLTATPQTDDRLQISLSTQSGALRLEGRGTWSPAAGLRFDGTARAQAEYSAALRELLSALGPRKGETSLLKFP